MPATMEPTKIDQATPVQVPALNEAYDKGPATGDNSIHIPVYVFLSPDGTTLDHLAPPTALPVGSWSLFWDLHLDPNLPQGTVPILSIQQFPVDILPGGVGTVNVPPTSFNDSHWTATITNTLPSNSIPTGFGYRIQVSDNNPDITLRLKLSSHDPSIAMVQDPMGG
jgi:hypothetical protein